MSRVMYTKMKLQGCLRTHFHSPGKEMSRREDDKPDKDDQYKI